MKILWIILKSVVGFILILFGGVLVISFAAGAAKAGIPNFPESAFTGLSTIILTIADVVLIIVYFRRQLKKSKKLLEGEVK